MQEELNKSIGAGVSEGCSDQLEILYGLMRTANSVVNVERFSCSSKNKYALVLYDLTCEHALSIVILVQNMALGSAFTLARNCIEAFVRAEWLMYASEKEGDEVYSSSRKWPSFTSMLKDIDHKNGTKNNYFSVRYGKKSYGVMSELAHGFQVHVDKRLAGETLKFHASEEEILELVKECCFVMIISNLSMAHIIENKSQAEDLKNLLDVFLVKFYK